MLDAMAEGRQERQERQKLPEGTTRLENIVERLTKIQEEVANLLASQGWRSPDHSQETHGN